MKKILSLILALLIVVSAMFAFASCEEKPSDDKNVEDNKDGNKDDNKDGNKDDNKDDNKENKKTDAELVIGTWEAEVDLTEALAESLGMDEEMSEYITIKDFKFTFRMTLNEDGTGGVTVVEETIYDAFANLKDSMVDGFEAYFTDMAAELNMTLNDFLAIMEVSSVEEFVSAFVNDEMLETMVEGFSSGGLYKVEDGKFYTSEEGEEIDESEYEVYELSEDEFKLIESVGGDEEDADLYEYIYPIIFKRVK